VEPKELKFDTRRSFGIEIEVGKEVSRDAIINFIKSRTRRNVKKSYYRPTVNNNYWDVKHDGSCGAKFVNGINEGGFEINSFKGSGVKDLIEICNTISNLKKIKTKTNKNCGFHIHVEVDDFDSNLIGVLLNNWIYIEDMMFSCVPIRRRYNKFCEKIGYENVIKKNTLKTADDFWDFYKPKSTALTNSTRRRSLNINNFYRSISLKRFNRKTIEFRFMESTLCGKNIKNWSRMLINFVEFCKKRNKLFLGTPTNSAKHFLDFVGLGNEHSGYKLSSGLSETRLWVLKRLARYGMNNHIKEEAKLLIKKESK
jgi:hypothetical protein